MVISYLGIGSNLGDRKKNIKLAIDKVSRLKNTKVIKVARLFETKAVGGPKNQPDFLNSAIKLKTSLKPCLLLKSLKQIEIMLGRKRNLARNSPRSIDLDILLYGNEKINQKNLIIPHPRMFKRDFVLRPLLEVL